VSGIVTLWRPAGSEELALVEASGWRESPPRLPGKSIFYLVLSEKYAAKIARDFGTSRAQVSGTSPAVRRYRQARAALVNVGRSRLVRARA
jgi:hypothetical protein